MRGNSNHLYRPIQNEGGGVWGCAAVWIKPHCLKSLASSIIACACRAMVVPCLPVLWESLASHCNCWKCSHCPDCRYVPNPPTISPTTGYAYAIATTSDVVLSYLKVLTSFDSKPGTLQAHPACVKHASQTTKWTWHDHGGYVVRQSCTVIATVVASVQHCCW